METAEYHHFSQIIEVLATDKAYDLLHSMEKNINRYAIGPDFNNNKILISKYALAIIKNLENQDYFVKADAFNLINKVLGYCDVDGACEEKIYLYKKTEDKIRKRSCDNCSNQ